MKHKIELTNDELIYIIQTLEERRELILRSQKCRTKEESNHFYLIYNVIAVLKCRLNCVDLMGDLMRDEESETYAKIMAGK